MNELLIILAFILATAGIIVAVWSIIDTRKRYYKEYIGRRDNNA